MRRDSRRSQKEEKNYNVLYIGGSILLIGIIAFVITFVAYGNKMDKQASLDNQKIASLVQGSNKDSEEVSTSMGKTVEEMQNETKTTENTTKNTNTNKTQTSTNTKTTKTNTNTVKKQETTKSSETKKTETKQEENKQEPLTFTKPVEGEIAKEYAKDKLVYSETLEEWATHLGWDIKADKTTVVKASANGKVKSIKNDPRYGLSNIIEHQDGYENLYASILSTEYVTLGEEVKQGQSIGTVGNSAAFEVADAPHLHFEIILNGESIDPSTFIK